jgi:4-alpha-glucanotransferase
MSKIFDSRDREYKSVFGAVKAGQICDFTVRIPDGKVIDSPPVMVIYRTGFKERFLIMTETVKEQNCTAYSVKFSAKYKGVHYYYFSVTSGGVREFIKKANGSVAAIGSDGGMYQLTVYDDSFKTPEFIKGGVMYQIFPDRFYASGQQHPDVPEDRVLRSDWGGVPAYEPDPESGMWNNDYFCGDLQGIIEKLPYLEELGVTCIYLNPIFEAHENHRYNTANYMKIDPLLGTNDDFGLLCGQAKRVGIDIILDGVFSHTGADSIYFNKNRRYDSVGAYNSEDSDYYKWYTFYEYPDSYESWWGIPFLPNVKETTQEYLDFICGDDGVLKYWLGKGAAGYRLDVADELPDKFLEELNRCVKEVSHEALVIGEVWEDASNKEAYGVKRTYLLGQQLDSVMNYPFRAAILAYAGGGSVRDFYESIMSILENYPKPSVDVLMNMISTHDTERAITSLSGAQLEKPKDQLANSPLTQQQYERGLKLFKFASALQFFLPGVPCVYYGDEAGAAGYKDPFNRTCFPWGSENRELTSYIKSLAEVRKNSDVFKDGYLNFLHLSDDIMIFERCNSGGCIKFIFNRSDVPKTVSKRLFDGSEDVTAEPYGYVTVKY